MVLVDKRKELRGAKFDRIRKESRIELCELEEELDHCSERGSSLESLLLKKVSHTFRPAYRERHLPACFCD